MTGVTLGVAALIVVLSVMNGFYDFVRDLLVSVDPHVRVVRAEGGGQGITNADSLRAIARSVESVKTAAPYVEGRALLMQRGDGERNQVVQVRGVDPSAMQGSTPTMAFGTFDVSQDATSPPGIVLDVSLARQSGLVPAGQQRGNSVVGLLSAPAIERTLTQVFTSSPVQQFEVRGLFDMQAATDRRRVFVSIDAAQRLFQTDGQVTGIDLRLHDLEQAASVKKELQRRLGSQYTVETWYDLQQSLYDVMRLEKWGASAILGLIVLVAAFNIVGSLTMVVIEKRRDVGVLQAMGASRQDVQRIFLFEGGLIGALGTGLGSVLGVGLALLQKHFKVVPMSQAESFLINAYPVSIRPLDVVLIASVSFGLCVLASVYPAIRAASIEPARAVHMDA